MLIVLVANKYDFGHLVIFWAEFLGWYYIGKKDQEESRKGLVQPYQCPRSVTSILKPNVTKLVSKTKKLTIDKSS